MSEIDIQNAKQIRDPMDVLIEMELASDDVTLSYSGYSGTAKVADGELDEPTWPMRKLADLQGDGFPLDGSCVLYDSSTSPSQANGKLGVRGNVGEAVTITITGNKSIASLFIFATGAESVTFGGTTTPIYNNVVTIPVGATSITITLNPASETTRIEVSQIEAGAKFRITNENLIRATVSLRSDLSIINQTLPESEINIEVYQDTDISEAVASIPEDTPIMYSAGYEGDMSPVRRFYVTGQVTWADNVLTIQGVDGVHFLNYTLNAPVFSESGTVRRLYYLMMRFMTELVPGWHREYADSNVYGSGRTSYGGYIIEEGWSAREIAAFMNNYMHQKLPDNSEPWPTYIDAGIPWLRVTKPQPMYTIYESDCGGVSKSVDSPVPGVTFNMETNVVNSSGVIGSVEWIKNVGGSVNYDGTNRGNANVSFGLDIGPGGGEENKTKWDEYIRGGTKYFGIQAPILPTNKRGNLRADPGNVGISIGNETKLTDSGVTQVEMYDWPRDEAYEQRTLFAAFVPWDSTYASGYVFSSQADAWARMVSAGIIPSDATSFELTIVGNYVTSQNEYFLFGDETNAQTLDFSQLTGRISAFSPNGREKMAFPNGMWEVISNTSLLTGKFTWKGDPRMQPRDVVEWERLDGTTTTITLENITLTHEGGGTSAEITYREGVV